MMKKNQKSMKEFLTDSGSSANNSISQGVTEKLDNINRNKDDNPCIPNLLEKNQPSYTFKFPQTNGRKVNHKWFQDHDWLHYDSERDVLLCYSCIEACNMIAKEKKGQWYHGAEYTFLSEGFKNWKKATNSFIIHEKSKFHRKCIQFIFNRHTAIPINMQLEDVQFKETYVAQSAMLVIISSLRFLALSGNAIRGHENDEGNFRMLLEERTLDSPGLKQWIERRDNYLSPQIQNEILEIMAHMVLRDIICEMKSALWFSVIADGTTDVSGMEQFSLSGRIVNPKTLEISEIFLGLYNPHDSTGKTLAAVIRDMLIRLTLSMENLRGHCFDGAANMSGCFKGVQKILTEEQPKSLYVHCSNHAADLALQEAARKTGGLCDILCLVKDSSNCILESAKRKTIYKDVVLPPLAGSTDQVLSQQLIAMCPTRWCVRVKSLIRYEEQYERVRKTLEAIVEEKSAISDERKAAVRGWLHKLQKFETMLFLKMSIEVFSSCEQLARALQNPSITATGAKNVAKIVINQLMNLRSEENFNRIYSETNLVAGRLELILPSEPRKRKIPRRLEQTNKPTPPAHLQPKDRYRKEYYEVLDILINDLKDRFDQDGLNTLEGLENIILEALKGNVYSAKVIKETLGIFSENFNIEDLHAQLLLLRNLLGETPASCTDFIEKISKESETTKVLLQQVIMLLVLIMTVPASAATAKRSFSALRRLKTYLRATITQKRLTHIVLLHVHKSGTRMLDLKNILKDFSQKNEERKRIFGKL